jgi:hypothetical protein
MKSYKKSKKSKNKKYQVGGNKTVTPPLPASGPELTYPADVTYGQTNLAGDFPTGTPLVTTLPEQFPNLQSKQLGFTQTPGMSNVDTSKVTINPTQNPNPRQVQNPNGDQPIYAYYPAPTVDYSMFDVDLDMPGIQQGPLPKDQQNRQLMTPVELTAQPEEETEDTDKKQRPDYNSMFTLGLAGVSTGLNMNADIQNRRRLQESIQQRDSKPLYDYNFMYGRTSTGGTEYQPIIKAEMGAQIDGRYNTPGMFNNVEIEGGEFLILPDGTTELAQGPSHSKGGISTTLPEGTKVFSNHLKPMGSKKTFAKLAKKYDNTQYDEVLNNKFAKQVDKDTALIMKQKNQKVLDKLFMDQQLMNGNSNGETMAKNGASIDNPGFRALPKAVQEQIIANMEYGGYSLPNPLYMQDGASYDTLNKISSAVASQVAPNLNEDDVYNNLNSVGAAAASMFRPKTENRNYDTGVIRPSERGTYTMDEWNNPGKNPSYSGVTTSFPEQELRTDVNTEDIANLIAPGRGKLGPTPFAGPFDVGSASPNPSNPSTTPSTRSAGKSATQPSSSSTTAKPSTASANTKKNNTSTNQPGDAEYYEAPGFQLYDKSKTLAGRTTPTGESSLAAEKTIEGYQKAWSNILPGVGEETSEADYQSKVYDYMLEKDPQAIADMWNTYGLTAKGMKDKELVSLTKDGKFDAETLKDPKVLAKLKEAYVDGMAGIRTLKPPTEEQPPVTPTPEPTDDTSKTPEDTPEDTPGDDTSKTPDFTSVTGTQEGQYIKQAFPLDQAIPGMMGLAAAQETFPYAMAQMDAPYLRPQEMNIQSQLQDIDNMTDAVIRSGGDPLTAMIQGTTAKEKAYQRKQNFDAMGRTRADMFNAQAEMQKKRVNAALLDRTYNQLYAQARDAGTAEKQKAISSLIQNKAKHDQSENIKKAYIDNLTSSYLVGKDSPSSFEVTRRTGDLINYGGLSPEDALMINLEADTLAKKAQSNRSKSRKTKTTKKK